MLCHKGDRLNQVCGIHSRFKSQVIRGVCIASLLFGILSQGGVTIFTSFDWLIY